MSLINNGKYTCYDDFIADAHSILEAEVEIMRKNRNLAAAGKSIGVVDQISKKFTPYSVIEIDEIIEKVLSKKFDPESPESKSAQNIVDELVEYDYPLPELKWDQANNKITLGFFDSTQELIISCVEDTISYTTLIYATDKELSHSSVTLEEAIDAIAVFFHGESEGFDFNEYL
jgi:hypothetical protein